ncbi:hypothetical protein PR202_gb16413 [Eleusine coracana subsp. coracana]|uniref:Uncharacterized protein n=1 Tax=Eleusine coracana subsp. coracana TaxID=191504 RepID=A0AAV5EY09_ELECO|nr:hypothetical protein QOZ80_9BG0698510 [Eleusine coracana subsp. coracana]GJN28304.1 hypothetical protein PR202_gb16413 [Eleusine coracana subsp. coracana]
MGIMAAAGVGRLARLQSRGKETQRTVNKIRVTLLSAFITFLLFRATIGINRLAHHSTTLVSSSHSNNKKLIVDDIDRVLRSDDPDDDLDQSSHASASSSSIAFHHAGASWSPHYRLGPRVTRWNAKRRRWLHAHPGFPSRDARGRERLLLVTAASGVSGPCANPVGAHLLLRAAKNKADYCRLHGLDLLVLHDTAASPGLHADLTGPGWSKLPLLRRLMLAHPETEWLWWLDPSAVVTDMGFDLPLDRYVTRNLVVHGDHADLFARRSWAAVSTRSLLLRNCQWSLHLLDAWATMGPAGRVRRDAGNLLSAVLTGRRRQSAEADDQSALVHLLLTDPDSWMDKVYVETQYHLHGPWARLVDEYEENAAHHHPGFGDDRWPFVTGFDGCDDDPCGEPNKSDNKEEEEDDAMEKQQRCVKGMERAFNFADNQVLRMYGFEHRTLESDEVRRVANRSADPLQAKEEAMAYLKKPKDPPPAPDKKTARRKRRRSAKGTGGESVLVRILEKLVGWRNES